jgi:transposase
MPTTYQLALTSDQEAELVRTRDHAQQPYLRERAAVLLKIAAGQSIRSAAATGGLNPHHHDTVGGWVARYQQEGLAGLRVRKGRGRKPACFSAAR